MATFTVTEQAATGAGSLAAAIAAAQASAGPDRIVFAADIKNIVTSGTLTIDGNVVIDGDRNNDGVADVTISSDFNTDGIGDHTLFVLGTGATVTFDGLVFSKGYDAGTSASDIAVGAILNNGAAIIRNSQFIDNQAVGWVGQNGATGGSPTLRGTDGTAGGAAAGAILNRGTMTIENTRFEDNSGLGGKGGAGGSGGYIPADPPFGFEAGGSGGNGADGGYGAGAIVNFTAGTLTLSGTAFVDNVGAAGNGGNGGDGVPVGLSVDAYGGTGGTAGHGSASVLDFGTMSGAGSIDGGSFSGGTGGNLGAHPPDSDDPYIRPDGFGGTDVIRIGTAGTDVRTATGLPELFAGLGGDDTFAATSTGSDTFAGGSGSDTVTFSAIAGGVHFSLFSANVQSVGAGTLTVVGVENATGGKGNDTLTGDGAANTLNGDAGNDTLDGALGPDVLNGGGGNDTFYVSDAGDVVIEVAGGGTDTVFADVNYALSADASVEALAAKTASGTSALDLTGNGLAQTITGNNGVNTIYGLGGDDTLNGGDDLKADTLYGGTGDDIFRVYTNADRVRETAGEGFDRVLASRDFNLFASAEIEMLTTSNSAGKDAIVLVGNAFTQTIVGNAGNNVLNSGGGGDLLRGLSGNDFYHVNSDDVVVETATGGTDTVNAHSNYVLPADARVEVLQSNDPGGTFARDLTGNAFAQSIIGGAGANTLDDGGGAGKDTLTGLGGNDTYFVRSSGAIIVEAAGGGTSDTLRAGASFNLAADDDIERMTTTSSGGTAAINLRGNSIVQEIIGNAGANIIDGKEGADTLRGLGGADTFVFGTKLGGGNIDTIVDFSPTADRFLLSDAIFTALSPGTITADQFRANTTGEARDATDRIVCDTDSGGIFYDADGLGGAAGVQFATVGVGLAITNADFDVV